MKDFSITTNNKLKQLKHSKNEILSNDRLAVNVVKDNIEIYDSIARTMAAKVLENNTNSLPTIFILPVGPRGQYRKFAKICNMENISCKNLITINMDEYLDEENNLIPESHPLSFRRFMKENLFNQLNEELKIKTENIHFPDPDSPDEIMNIILEQKGADICFGGVGINGHIAFNEPQDEDSISINDFLQLKTRILDVTRDTIIVNSLEYGGNVELIPARCITIGMTEIFMSKELRFYLEHNWQSAVLRKTIFWEPSPSFPSTFLKEHKNSSITISENVLKDYMTK